jgi:hypothetical protein
VPSHSIASHLQASFHDGEWAILDNLPSLVSSNRTQIAAMSVRTSRQPQMICKYQALNKQSVEFVQ